MVYREVGIDLLKDGHLIARNRAGYNDTEMAMPYEWAGCCVRPTQFEVHDASSGGARDSPRGRAAGTSRVLLPQSMRWLCSATALGCPNDPHADRIER
jgi:hypothetical protein